jgi:hypothetical protein
MTNPTASGVALPGPAARFTAVRRSPDIEDGLAARLADPLWMLARQWQLGEFRGDDAGSLVSLSFTANAHLPTWWRPEPDADHPAAQPWQGWTVDDGPLQSVIDAESDDGTALLRLRIDGGVAARRALCAVGLPAVAARLPAAAPWSSDTIAAAGALNALAMASTADPTALDGFIAPWSDPAAPMPAAVIAALGVAAAEVGSAAAALRGWQTWWRSHSTEAPAGQNTGPVDPAAWDASRLEYRGSLGFASAPGVRLIIDRHPGGTVDWYSADITAAQPADFATAPAPPATLTQPQTFSAPAIPQPARLPGMPALRFWEYEDAAVDFGSIDAEPADLARLLLVDYTTVYDHNWYYAPIRIPVGALVEVSEATPVTVVDSFGISETLGPLAERPDTNTVMFTPSGLSSIGTGPAPNPAWSTRWFWFAPRLAATLDSDPIEQVTLRRDEAANLGWAIVETVSTPDGRVSAEPTLWPATPPAAATPFYTLQTQLPDTWRALVPTPITYADELDGAYLLVLTQPAPGTGTAAQPAGRLLAATPWQIHEEELGDAGLTLIRTRSLGRWYGGRVFTWAGRTVQPSNGEADSGLTWDYLR